jgi:hydrogenase expression/formation protein HypD
MGTVEYERVAQQHGVPIVITGFEPVDLLEGVLRLVRLLEQRSATVEIQYSRVVQREGNRASLSLVERVFEVCDRTWRGVGEIPQSGFRLRSEYAEQDAEKRFSVGQIKTRESPECISGAILRGLKKPLDCPAFGKRCTPERPLGATMVSSEGACAAYFHAGRAFNPTAHRLQLVSP